MVTVMTDVNAVGTMASSATLQEFAHQSFRRGDADRSTPNVDRVEISEVATFLSRLAEIPEARARRIVDIRNAIENGTYDVDSKLTTAIDRLFGDL